jgi:hypothetical protein
MQIEPILERLRRKVHLRNHPSHWPEQMDRFHFLELDGLFHVEYYGDSSGIDEMLTELSRENVAPVIASIQIGGPDEGANGTKNWDLTLLATSAATFANLRYLIVEQTRPTDHNCRIIGRNYYEEDGMLAEIASKAPMLTQLTVPSAPSSAFFDVNLEHLECLNVDAGYETQDFILNLSQSTNLPRLRYLEWGEYHGLPTREWLEKCTPFAHYQSLFRSEAFRLVKAFVFRNPVCSEAELAELQTMRPDLQILVVRSTGEYVRIARRSPSA